MDITTLININLRCKQNVNLVDEFTVAEMRDDRQALLTELFEVASVLNHLLLHTEHRGSACKLLAVWEAQQCIETYKPFLIQHGKE